MFEALWATGVRLVEQVQQLGPGLIEPMRAVSALGRSEFYLLLLTWLYWCGDPTLGRRLVLMVVLSGSANEIAKILMHQPRPYWLSTGVSAWSSETSFGLPSGHSQHSLTIAGVCAWSWRNRWVRVLLALLVLAIGFSRVYLGMHFAHDVLGGWLLGGVLLVAWFWAEPRLTRWLARCTFCQQCLLVSSISLALLAFVALIPLLLGTWVLPQSWAALALAQSGVAIDPLGGTDLVRLAGLLLGLGFGLAWVHARGGVDAQGTWKQRVLRYCVGLIGALIFWYGPKLLPEGQGWVAIGVRYLRYALVGLWVTGAAPLLFVRWGLAAPVVPAATRPTGT